MCHVEFTFDIVRLNVWSMNSQTPHFVEEKKSMELDPNECNKISLTNSRRDIARLEKDGFVMRRPTVVYSRSRVRERNKA